MSARIFISLFSLLSICWVGNVEAFFKPHYKHRFPTYYHTIRKVGTSGKVVQIEDGSIWEVKDDSRAVVAKWKKGENVLISPRNDEQENNYYLTNVSMKEYCPVTLSMPPLGNTGGYCSIRCIDHFKRRIETQTNSGETQFWEVEPQDETILNDWVPEQVVIIGSNDGWYSAWFSRYNAVLINAEQYKYIRVKLVK